MNELQSKENWQDLQLRHVKYDTRLYLILLQNSDFVKAVRRDTCLSYFQKLGWYLAEIKVDSTSYAVFSTFKNLYIVKSGFLFTILYIVHSSYA